MVCLTVCTSEYWGYKVVQVLVTKVTKNSNCCPSSTTNNSTNHSSNNTVTVVALANPQKIAGFLRLVLALALIWPPCAGFFGNIFLGSGKFLSAGKN